MSFLKYILCFLLFGCNNHYLKRCNLNKIDKTGHEIKILDLSDGRYCDLSNYTAKLVNVEELYLRNNNLYKVEYWIFDLANLRKLNLSKNNLSAMPPEISKLINIQVLYLTGNNLTTLPKEISKLQNLRCIVLEQNPIDLKELGRLRKIINDSCKIMIWGEVY